MDKIDYKSRLKQLKDPDRAKDFIEKFGKDTYNKFYNYYSTKVFIKDNGLDQDTFAPSYRYIDDLITNYAGYVNQYGKKGYNTYYSLVWENVKPEADTLQKAAKIKSGGYFSADILNQATDLGNMYKYTDDEDDQIRQKLGLVPKAFDSAAKKIVKQAAEIRKQRAASDPNATEQSLLDKFSPSSGWDFLDDKPVTEKDVRDAISVILRQNAVSQYGDIYAGGGARYASTVPDRTGGQFNATNKAVLEPGEAQQPSVGDFKKIQPTTADKIHLAQQTADQYFDTVYDTRSGAVRGAMTDINYNEWQDLGKTSLPEGTKYDPKTGLIISSTVVPEGVDLMYNPEAAVAVQEVENLNDLITRLREKKASGQEVTDAELKPLADKGLTKIIDVIKNTTPENVAYHRPAGTQVASELEKTTQATKYHTKQAVAEAGYTAAMQSDPQAQQKIAQVSGTVDFSGDNRKRIVAMLNAADGAQADNPAANIANFASGGLASIDLIKYAYTTPEQRNVLRYLYSIGDTEGFDAYAEAISRELNRRKADDQKKTIDKTFGQSVGGKIGAGALAALSGLGAGVGWIESGINAIKGVPTDPYSTWQSPAYTSDMLRETALEGASDVGKFFGNVGISLAQNAPLVAANIATGGAAAPVTLGVMGASAAGQATQQALQSGATSGEAFLSGAAAGAIEVLTEKLPLDNLVRIGQAAKSAGKGAVVKTILANMPKQAAIEAGEEIVAEIANNLADYIIMGDRSQIEQYKQSLIDSGMSPDEAERQAFLRFYVANPALAGAGGAVSGAVFAGAGGAMGNIIGNLQQRAANIRTQAEAKALIDEIDALIPQADPEAAGQLTTIKQNLDQWGLEKSKQVVENAKQNANEWNDAATARLMNENRVNTENVQQPAQNTPNVENAIPSAEPVSDGLFADMPEVQTGRRGGISIPAIPDIGDVKTKTSKVAKSVAVHTGDTVLKKQIGDGLFDYIPQSAEPVYTQAYNSISDAKDVIAQYENPVETVTKGERQTTTERRYSDNDTATVVAGLVKAYESGTRTDQQKLLAIAVDMGVMQGRSVNMWKMLRKLDATGRLFAIERGIAQMNAEGRRAYGNKWQDFSLTEEEIETIRKGNKKAEWDAAEKAIYKRIADQMPATWAEKDAALRRFAMLFNPKTHIRNIVGNSVMVAMIEARDKLMAVGELFLEKDQRTKAFVVKRSTMERAREFFRENNVADQLAGMKYEIGKQTVKGHKKRVFKTKAFHVLDTATTKTLEIEDNIFKHSRYIKSLARFMDARGITEVTQEAHEYAMQDALEATFQDRNEVARLIQQLKRTRGGVIVDIAVPFVTTTTNIAWRTVQYSPFGLGQAGYDFIKAHQLNAELKKTTDAAQAKQIKANITKTLQNGIKHLAQGMVGTGLMALGFLLAGGKLVPEVFISGLTPPSTKEKEFLKNNGWQPLALQIGDTYISMEWLTPSASIMLAGAQAYHSTTGEDKNWYDVPLESMTALFQTVLDSSVFTGIKKLMANEWGGVGKAVTDLATDYVSQHIPSLGVALGNIAEENKVSYYSPDSVKEVKYKAIMSIPGLRQILEENGIDVPKATLDSWGKPIKAGNLWQRVFDNFFNPAKVTKTPDDPVFKELMKLYESTGDTKVFPRILSNKITTKEVKEELKIPELKLTDDEMYWLKQELGQSYYRLIKAYIKSPPYRRDSDETKVNTISGFYDSMIDSYRTQLIRSKIPSVSRIGG